MPLSEGFADLLDLLRKGTEKKVLKWGRTPSADVFRIELPEGDSVRLIRDATFLDEEDRGPRFILTLLNPEGRVLDEWFSADLGDEVGQLYVLYREARRSTVDYDRELKTILKSLRSKIPDD
jgi:hypothetical protein